MAAIFTLNFSIDHNYSTLYTFSRCNCGNCNIENLVEAKECRCCTELPNCVAALSIVNKDVFESSDDDATNTQQICITNHPGFDAICLNRWSLELASDNLKHVGLLDRNIDKFIKRIGQFPLTVYIKI